MMLDFCLRLRDEKKFENIDALKKQIERDVARTRKYLNRLTPILKEEISCR